MINFTEEHKKKLDELCLKALFEDTCIANKFGNVYNICQLLTVVSINQLNEIKNKFSEKITKIEQGDEWVQADPEELEDLKFKKELLNLIIGYKRHKSELKEIEIKRNALLRTLETLEESQKTPEEKIKELKAQIAELS